MKNPFETTLQAEERRRIERKKTYRVVCQKTLETRDGDLVLVGTHGTLLGWSDDATETGCVVVKWDHHMYADTFSEDHGATDYGLMADIHPDYLTHTGATE